MASFDAGPEFKHGFFRDTAVELLLPVAQLSQKVFHDTADLQAFRLLSASYSPLQLIRKRASIGLRRYIDALEVDIVFEIPFMVKLEEIFLQRFLV